MSSCAALLRCVQVVRDAAVTRFADAKPEMAARNLDDSPCDRNFAIHGRDRKSARDHRAVPSSAFALMKDAAAKAPLAPEPFLVAGMQAQLGGDNAKAQRAFEAAQWRDPRSLPAAYFLADRYLRSGMLDCGLAEVAALARLSPNGPAGVGALPCGLCAQSGELAGAAAGCFETTRGSPIPALVNLAVERANDPGALALLDPRRALRRQRGLRQR